MVDFEAASGFTIERLRTFCRIAESGSIVLAAKGDPTRQSQFSRQVKELEEFCAAKLLERAGKTVRLTDAGRTLAVLTQSYFRSVEQLRTSSTKVEVIRLGAGDSVFRWMLMPRLAELQGISEGVRFEFYTHSTEESIDGVKAGQLDLAIVRKDVVDDSLNTVPCGAMKYALVVPRTLLPGRTAAGLETVKRLPFGLLTGDGVLAQGVLKMAAQLGVDLDVKIKADRFSLLLVAIENADLAAVLPAPAIPLLSMERFAVVELDGVEILARDLVLVHSPHAAELRPAMRRMAPRIAALLSGGR
jgi:DNA-binding transcriptional LysR family regulator